MVLEAPLYYSRRDACRQQITTLLIFPHRSLTITPGLASTPHNPIKYFKIIIIIQLILLSNLLNSG